MKPFDASGAFVPHVDEGQVRRLAIRGAGVTVFSAGMGLAAQIISTVILARLLTPADFGVVTMVTTFSLLLLNFGLNGFTEAVIQREQIDHFLISNLFWINVGFGLILALGFAAFGSLLARFYHEPTVALVSVGISAGIFFTSTSVQHLALLKRAMRFSATSANEVFSRVFSLSVSIVLAWIGWGYWALVAGAVVQPLAQSIGAWYLCRWTPGLPRRVAGTASMLRFAMNVYGRFSVNYFARNSDNLLVGWRFGANALGFYKKAYDLFALSAGQLTAPLTNVAVSALSRFNPRSKQYRHHLLEAMSVVAFVGMGLSAEFTLVGKDLIRLVLGKGWETAGRIFTFFGPGIGAMLIYYIHSWIHLSIGKADRWFRWGLIEVAVTILAFIVALPWGPSGIAMAWTASYWVLTIPSLWYAGKPIDFRIGPMLSAIWKYVLAALLAGCASAAIIPRIPFLSALSDSVPQVAVRVSVITVLFGILYLSAVIVLYRGITPLIQFAGRLREMTSPSEPLPTFPVEEVDSDARTHKAFVSKHPGLKPLV